MEDELLGQFTLEVIVLLPCEEDMTFYLPSTTSPRPMPPVQHCKLEIAIRKDPFVRTLYCQLITEPAIMNRGTGKPRSLDIRLCVSIPCFDVVVLGVVRW